MICQQTTKKSCIYVCWARQGERVEHFPVFNRVGCVLLPVWNLSPSSAQAVWEIWDWTGTPSLWIRSRVQTGCRWSLCRASPSAALQRPAGNTSAPLRWSALTSGDTTSAGDVKTPRRHNGTWYTKQPPENDRKGATKVRNITYPNKRALSFLRESLSKNGSTGESHHRCHGSGKYWRPLPIKQVKTLNVSTVYPALQPSAIRWRLQPSQELCWMPFIPPPSVKESCFLCKTTTTCSIIWQVIRRTCIFLLKK